MLNRPRSHSAGRPPTGAAQRDQFRVSFRGTPENDPTIVTVVSDANEPTAVVGRRDELQVSELQLCRWRTAGRCSGQLRVAGSVERL